MNCSDVPEWTYTHILKSPMEFTEFESIIRTLLPEADGLALERFRKMDELYRDWNSKINVISRKDIDHLYDHHILHSL